MKKFLIFSATVFTICFVVGISRAEYAENKASTTIVVKGSTTVKPIVEKIAESYRSKHPDIKIEISGGGSGNGIMAIIDGTTDIGNSSRFIKQQELRYAHGKGIFPVPFQVAYDCIVPVVNSKNGIGSLTLEQLQKIYMGSIDNWKLVGGSDSPIKVVSRDSSSGTYEVWEKKVMEGRPVLPNAHLESSNESVVKTIAADVNAIGYIGLGYINETIKSVSVDNIKGSVETTHDGSYKLSRPLYMFTKGWPEGELLKFINYILNPNHGQKIVVQTGFVALYEIDPANRRKEMTVALDPNYLPEVSTNITMIQEYLSALGYDVGPVDGIKGGKTITAIVDFQKQNGLPLEWRISHKMVSVLSDQYLQLVQAEKVQ